MYRVQKVWKSLLSIWFVAATAVMMFRCFVAGAQKNKVELSYTRFWQLYYRL